ncbi:hypothetical protein Cgig2_004911 [Carnegiea gigantea]|uniref:Uncharacterized protein n=1 Tax=Carnegiea gigantea TaxID=171969 RepID=A0A9Q1L0U7_9CARY|nr:hypothetical protein Cgig2_004911 [Carnegiea gigantea]
MTSPFSMAAIVAFYYPTSATSVSTPVILAGTQICRNHHPLNPDEEPSPLQTLLNASRHQPPINPTNKPHQRVDQPPSIRLMSSTRTTHHPCGSACEPRAASMVLFFVVLFREVVEVYGQIWEVSGQGGSRIWSQEPQDAYSEWISSRKAQDFVVAKTPCSNRVHYMPSSVISSHSMHLTVLTTTRYAVNTNMYYVCRPQEAQIYPFHSR